MINEETTVQIETYLIKTHNRRRKGVVVLSNGESQEIPVQQLRLFYIPDFCLN